MSAHAVTKLSPSISQRQTYRAVQQVEESWPLSCPHNGGCGCSINTSTGSIANEKSPKQGVSVSTIENQQFASIDFLSPWLPAVDPRKTTWRTRKSQRSVVIWSSLISMFIIFVVNLTVSIVGWTKYSLSNDGVATLYEGDCTAAKRLNTGLHVLINVLSTILLGMSNLSLQLMVSPTRSEVDAAHRKGHWLDIGVPSIRNLWRLPLSTIFFATLLAVSSIPIHFLYNASVFSTVSTNAYLHAIVTEAFLRPDSGNLTFTLENGTAVSAPQGIDGSLYTINRNPNISYGSWTEATDELRATIQTIHQDVRMNLQTYHNLSNYQCLDYYTNPYVYRPNVLLVSTDYDMALRLNTSLLGWGWHNPDSFTNAAIGVSAWTHDQKQWPKAPADLSDSVMDSWIDGPDSFHVRYCLQVPDTAAAAKFAACRVQCAPSILLVISIFNICKCVSVIWLLYGRHQQTLCTLGDAIASFLEYPDDITKRYGVTTTRSIRNVNPAGKHLKGTPQIWTPKNTTWYWAASKRRWCVTMLASIVVLICGTFLFAHGIFLVKKYYKDVSWDALWSVGFGATSYKELIDWKQKKTGVLGLFVNIVITNIWQVLVSLCYLTLNALFSCQIIADEWSRYAKERKSLRVSHPSGIQRSTYFISMPLKYGMPIMALFALEHWLLSQTTFIVRVATFDFAQTPASVGDSYTTSGYSILPAMFSIALFSLPLFAQLANGFLRKYPVQSAMPLVATCSLAISANCHRPEDDRDAHLLPVQWGVVETDGRGVQKCSFTTLRAVRSPAVGSTVLGLSEESSPDRMSWAGVKESVLTRYKKLSRVKRIVSR